eukprot:GHRR01006931.1.p1 GENE.GHRR01006931.1~~GHRR01006931.1.p1  ORF type:complete len:409 (+),score=114.47 GHRR01006931.1:1331-2557(+)
MHVAAKMPMMRPILQIRASVATCSIAVPGLAVCAWCASLTARETSLHCAIKVQLLSCCGCKHDNRILLLQFTVAATCTLQAPHGLANYITCLGQQGRCVAGIFARSFCEAWYLPAGFCELGVSWQSMENPDMKLALGMPRGMTGVYITKTEPMYDASSKLRAGDVLTHFNGVEIADDGTFLFREAVRINFGHLVSQAFHGDEATCKVWRDGQHLTLPVVLSTPHQLVPVHSHDVKPSYFIYAGLVFTPLTSWYLRSVYGADWSCKAPIKLVEKAFAASMKQTGEEVVVLSKVLASDINAGYQDIANIQVLSVNGQKVANLAHLAYLIKTCQDKFVKLQLEWSKVLFIDHQKATRLLADILEQNSIPAAHSKKLLDADHPGKAAVAQAPDADAATDSCSENEAAVVCKL